MKHIGVSPLTGRILQGRINKAGDAFSGEPEDITSHVLRAIIDKALYHKGEFEIAGGDRKWVVTVKEVYGST